MLIEGLLIIVFCTCILFIVITCLDLLSDIWSEL